MYLSGLKAHSYFLVKKKKTRALQNSAEKIHGFYYVKFTRFSIAIAAFKSNSAQ